MRAADRWCFAPLVGSVRGKVNGPELTRVVVVGVCNALAAGIVTRVGIEIAVLDSIRYHAADIFAPSIAAFIAAISSAGTSYMHRKYEDHPSPR